MAASSYLPVTLSVPVTLSLRAHCDVTVCNGRECNTSWHAIRSESESLYHDWPVLHWRTSTVAHSAPGRGGRRTRKALHGQRHARRGKPRRPGGPCTVPAAEPWCGWTGSEPEAGEPEKSYRKRAAAHRIRLGEAAAATAADRAGGRVTGRVRVTVRPGLGRPSLSV